MANNKFQNIQGLRAISVISVIFFHYEINYFKGGYLGVDIFFVISGYLMSLILDVKIDKKNIVNFYIKRIKRILPALIFIILITLIFGFFLLGTANYERLGKSSISSLLFLSNFFFWREWGYFDLNSLSKPLLHTWSLSVEMQFYFIFPVILFVLNNIFKKIEIIFKLIFLFSIAILITEIFVETKKVATFYLMPFRLSEFLIGSIGYYCEKKYNNKLNNSYIFIFALIIILICFLNFDKDTRFPGISSFLPCFMAIIIILNKDNYLANKILKSNFLIFLGNISYSLYLVHWPVYIFYRLFKFREIYIYEKILLVLISILFSYLINKYVENIYRYRKNFNIANYLNVYSFLTIIFFSVSVIYFNGLSFRMNNEVSKNKDLETQKVFLVDKDKLTFNKCYYNSSNKNIDLNLVGDSHAMMYANALIELAENNNLNICITNILLDCNVFQGSENRIFIKKNCEERRKAFIKTVKKNNAQAIILAHYWAALNIDYEKFSKNYKKFYDEISPKKNKKILFVLSVPQFSNGISNESCSNHPKYLIKKRNCVSAKRTDKIILRSESTNNLIKKNLEINSENNMIFLDPFNKLCDKSKCLQVIKEKDVYIDPDHLGVFSSKFLIHNWKGIIFNNISYK